MKLFGFFLSSALATNDGDRMFSDRPEFLANIGSSGWDAARAGVKMGELKSETNFYFNDYIPIHDGAVLRAKNKMEGHLEKLQDDLQSAMNKCYEGSRKRRSDDDNTRWALVTDQGNRVAWNGLAWQYANWIRQVIAPNGSNKCNKLALRLYRRLDRLNFIWKWHACTKGVSPNETDCQWAAQNQDGSQKKHPRKEAYLNKMFGRDVESQYRVTGCDDNNDPSYRTPVKMSCPFGGTITVQKAEYGRENTGECAKNPSGTYEQCMPAMNIIGPAMGTCNGKTECEFAMYQLYGSYAYKSDDPCPGVDKFTKVVYTCT